jgi:CRISPR-associated protein Cmr3
MSQAFSLEPRDTLVIRDGRAMNGTTGRSLPFPLPSTIAGTLRTHLGRRPDGSFDRSMAFALLRGVSVRGPWLARTAPATPQGFELFAPAPTDCLWFGKPGSDGPTGWRLALRGPSPTDALFDDAAPTELPRLPEPQESAEHAKPARGAAYWPLRTLLQWLEAPADCLDSKTVGGIDGLERETRHHIEIDPSTGTVRDGALFGVEGLRFAKRAKRGQPTESYALLGTCDVDPAHVAGRSLGHGVVSLGGERRIAHLGLPQTDGLFPGPPPWLRQKLGKGTRARVVLVTPAIFNEGAMPQSIQGARVVSACVGRPEVVSGWDFAINRPKASRRMVPAGSVYWVEVPSDTWAESTWMTNLSESDQDARDGFGLALIGVG